MNLERNLVSMILIMSGPITTSSDIGSTMYSNLSYLHSNRANLSSSCQSDNNLESESNAARENLISGHVSSAQASNKQIFVNDSGGTSEHDYDLCNNASSPDSYRQVYEPQEATVNLQQLSLGEE